MKHPILHNLRSRINKLLSQEMVTAKKLEFEIMNACKEFVYETIFKEENIKLMNHVPDVHGDWLSTDKSIYELLLLDRQTVTTDK